MSEELQGGVSVVRALDQSARVSAWVRIEVPSTLPLINKINAFAVLNPLGGLIEEEGEAGSKQPV
jgi:hypothetical protein